ncbi:adenine phosphoribosyltransferase [Methanocella sp. CWC-04]|uniref:Hypoxanthine/guanine phosphoribosyltransferase n=1 Tax=Methanooceanicella nereidis TaxID=2052831 RepID=A0AAP2RDU1_9EURY|nr:adenine phosphoribosyltransferase [Methanocella sp. CWC-04]
MLKNLRESLRNAPIIKRGSYNYFIHPISDGVPVVRPELLREVIACIVKNANVDVDKIVTIEAMGLPLGSALSQITDIPFIIIRKRKYELPGEIAVHQATGYSKGELYLNGIDKGDRVLIVDDVISTGGTMLATLKALEMAGATVKDIIVVIERGDGKKEIIDMGYDIKTLIKIDVDENGVKVLECIDGEC